MSEGRVKSVIAFIIVHNSSSKLQKELQQTHNSVW